MTWFSKALREAGWAPISVVVCYAVAAKGFDAYLRWPNLDMPTHFIGGLAITYFFATAVRYAQTSVGSIPKAIRLLLSLGLMALAAVSWEFLEYLSDVWLGTKMNLGVSDTLSDLFFGILGAVAMALVLGRSSPTPNR